MYRTILVPTDGSHGSTVAAEHALDLAATHDATLHAIHVVSPDQTGGLARPTEAVQGLREYGRELVERVERKADRRDVPFRGSVVEGRPHEAILEYAEDHDVDLIVMGTHGRTGLQRYLLGSVTERVVRKSDVPVLTMTPDTAPEVEDAETASEVARKALQREGHERIDLADPHRGATAWVVHADTDRGEFNVHVSTDGSTHVARIPDRSE